MVVLVVVASAAAAAIMAIRVNRWWIAKLCWIVVMRIRMRRVTVTGLLELEMGLVRKGR
jgi:hypothetical protein